MNSRAAFSLLLISLLLVCCKSPAPSGTIGNHVVSKGARHQYLFFVVSSNSINSRISQDQLVRLSSYPSIQSYLYIKGRIYFADNMAIRQKLSQDGYDYAMFTYLVDSSCKGNCLADSGSYQQEQNFFNEYSTNIEPYAYNPTYLRKEGPFKIKTVIYYLPDDKPVWSMISKSYPSKDLEISVKKHLESLIQTLKKQGFMK